MFDFLRRRNSQRRTPPKRIASQTELDLVAERLLLDLIQRERDRIWIDRWNGRTMTTDECAAATGFRVE